MPTYYVRTFGCQMNEHDSERIAGLLETRGYSRSSSLEDADVVVLNTCAIRENADNRLYGTLGHLKALKESRPEMRLAVGGCLVQKDKEVLLGKAPWVDVAFGTFAVADLPELLDRRERSGIPAFEFKEQGDVFPSALPARREVPFHAWISISVGCDNACSFCIVPKVRGPQRSRSAQEILQEARMACEEGVVEITLLGQNVNTYGRDLYGSPRFGELLVAMDEVSGLKRVRFTSPNPHDFTQDVVEAIASSRVVCEHIHFPMQSGSDSVLHGMRRSYRREGFLQALEGIRVAVPGIAVSTDVIVGFPGETDGDFEKTLEVLEKARFDSAYTFQFSARSGTQAATLPDQVPPAVVADRFAQLVERQEDISLERNREVVGRVVEVLVEGPSRKDSTVLTTRTRTNKIVHVRGGLAAGSFALVEVTGAHPHHLDGRIAT